MEENKTILNTIKSGNMVIVNNICSGTGVKIKLTEMGITHGTKIKVIYNDGWGPMVIALSGSRMALGRQITKKIIVIKENNTGNEE